MWYIVCYHDHITCQARLDGQQLKAALGSVSAWIYHEVWCCRLDAEQSDGNIEQMKKKRRKSVELKPENFDDVTEGLPERLGDHPLRAIIVGTNPSGHAWYDLNLGLLFSTLRLHMFSLSVQNILLQLPPSIRNTQNKLCLYLRGHWR